MARPSATRAAPAYLHEAVCQTALLDAELFEHNVYRQIQNGLGTLQMQALNDPVRKARREVLSLIEEIEAKRKVGIKEKPHEQSQSRPRGLHRCEQGRQETGHCGQ